MVLLYLRKYKGSWLLFKHLLYWFKSRVTETWELELPSDGSLSNCLPKPTQPEPGQNLDPETPSWSPTWWVVTMHMGHLLLHFQVHVQGSKSRVEKSKIPNHAPTQARYFLCAHSWCTCLASIIDHDLRHSFQLDILLKRAFYVNLRFLQNKSASFLCFTWGK